MNEYYKIFAWTECPYCVKAKELLLKHNKQFMFCCIDESKELLAYIKEEYNWMTVPMIILHKRHSEKIWVSEFIGGFSDLQVHFRETTESEE